MKARMQWFVKIRDKNGMKNESYFLAKKISKKNRENERDKNESAKIRQKIAKKTLLLRNLVMK